VSIDPAVPMMPLYRVNDNQLPGKTVAKVVAFKDNSLFLTDDGRLYECGDLSKIVLVSYLF